MHSDVKPYNVMYCVAITHPFRWNFHPTFGLSKLATTTGTVEIKTVSWTTLAKSENYRGPLW